MSFPPAFLDELRARLPLSEVAARHLRLTRAGREFKACCPFHNEKTPSFTINDDKQFFHCFGCGAHGDVIGFVMRHDRLSFPEAVESLAAQAGLPVPQNTPMDRERFDHEKRLHQLLEHATAWFEEQMSSYAGREARGYLQRRSVSDKAIKDFRLGYASGDGQALIRRLVSEGYKIEELVAVGLAKKAKDRNEYFSFFRNRVIFPIDDSRKRPVAFGARILGEGEPKYLNSPDHSLFHKGKMLYGLSGVRSAITQNKPLIIVEGYMDVIALVEAGYTGAVAPLGTALTEDQLIALWKLLPPFETRDPTQDYGPILCFDGDNAGSRAAERSVERALPLLTSAQTIRIAEIKGSKDPDELIRQHGKDALQPVITQAKPVPDYIWKTTVGDHKLTKEKLTAVRNAVMKRIAQIGDITLRKLYQDNIWQLYKLNADTLKQEDSDKSRKRSKMTLQERESSILDESLVRIPPLKPHRLREKAFLALMINHPALFNDFGEELALISFATPEFEALRQRVVAILSLDSHEPLDVTELYRHLSPEGESGAVPGSGQAGLAEVLSETTYMHVGFARPDRSLDQARQGWKSIWNKYLQEQLHVDLQTAKRRYTEDASDENLTRLMALGEQMEALKRESGDQGILETSFLAIQEN